MKREISGFDNNTDRKNLLSADHSELDGILDELTAAFENGGLDRIYQKLDFFWARLAMHIRAEHLHLFPAIIRASELRRQPKDADLPSFETVKSALEQLRGDHNFFMREIISLIKQLRSLRDSRQGEDANRLRAASDAMMTVKTRLETHNDLEETVVYGWADSLLDSEARLALNEKMRQELDNLPPRFSGF